MTLYDVDPVRSSVNVSGKSSLHPMHGTARSACLSGTIEATVAAGAVDLSCPTRGRVEFPVAQLSFGNSLYDRELPKRLDTRRYPLIVVELTAAAGAGESRMHLDLDLTFHGVTRHFSEDVSVVVGGVGDGSHGDSGTLVISGRHSFDVRDFDVHPPKILGLSVKPDFDVEVELVARAQA